MITRTLGEISVMIGATDLSDKHATIKIEGVSIDSRSVKLHNLYIPIKGERFNGHEFCQAAAANGAVAALWNKSEPNPPQDMPLLFVDDTLAAIQRLAQAYRSQLDVKVIGITGSNGKTSVKDILAGLLATTFKTQKTSGNLNNHLGVPLTLLRLQEDTEMAVVEMGMSGLGEINQLAAISQLDAAIITSVSEVHLGDLHSRERIAEAKLEIIHGLKSNGLLIYNGDNPIFMEQFNKQSPVCRSLSFGYSPAHALHPLTSFMNENGIFFSISDADCPELFLPMLGKHQMINALSAIAAARHFGISYEQIKQGLLQVEATGMRCELVSIGNCTVINDAYKSNPTSLRAALEALYAWKGKGSKRKIAVIGDMVELGQEAEDLHKEIGEELDATQLDAVFTIGSMAKHIALSAMSKFPYGKVTTCMDKQEVIDQLKQIIQEDCIILIKGSRGLRLEDIITALQKEVAFI
ncbi:UDP-N-acetylmuramoyl-tripeptide--D-alanyl-D-alanine ligase [Paenibacillus eucommiae]|uniref:UDP-N-acetylmuramoyl-tripeptide--D-alanyl-D-alanine ligase n=1 Tax=Paenibacillus eucommiae TaxID=1355755 RepID=A0ABS4IN55_9BACL|nr:UDP-N-acetylmuramoyl-tripeptide--D-alanyl-D-alanine ligase [Paenibacillus eucommiae]MBP1989002.1 UDP-N-acetylmuramoyl-tripeptide--D-alanyl-D-alanine ligase [Paenibacillus eucommiae]